LSLLHLYQGGKVTLPTPSQDLVDEWFQWWLDAGGPSQGVHQHQWIANKAAEWGYRQCNATYEQAAMQLVTPTWIEVDNDEPS
jgi:hypothetical protein